MSYKNTNKYVFVSVLSLLVSMIIGLPTALGAAEKNVKKTEGTEKTETPLPPFIKAPVVDTKFTQHCVPLGLAKAPKGAKRRTYALKPSNFKYMERAADAMSEERYDEAIVILKELIVRTAERPYDSAKAHEYLGYAQLSKGNYDQAILHFRTVIDKKILPVRNEQSLIRNVAGLYLAIEPTQPKKAMEIIERWFKTAVKPKATDYVLLGQAAIVGKMYAKSICPIRIAINLSDRPKSSWFDILVAAHFEADDFEGAAILAKERLLSFPEKAKYWRQLSGLYNKLEKSMDSLIIYELAHKQNMLVKGSEYRNLSSMYSINDLPYKSAAVLEEGIKKGIVEATEKHWKQAAGGWQLARENKRAIAAYIKAGSFSENGLNEMRIASLYTNSEEWPKAVKFFEKAISKGGLKKQLGRTHMNLGIALFNAGKTRAAIKALKKAQSFKRTKRNASQWLNYVRDAEKVARS